MDANNGDALAGGIVLLLISLAALVHRVMDIRTAESQCLWRKEKRHIKTSC